MIKRISWITSAAIFFAVSSSSFFSLATASERKNSPSVELQQRPSKNSGQNRSKPNAYSTLPAHPYQDVWINGKIVARGEGPDCQTRYQAIKPLLDTYKRPFTVLDIGAAEGYFSFRIASEYQAYAVMIGSPTWNNNFLQTLCETNKLNNVTLLSKEISSAELQRLSECEHFDVVIAFNVIHHFGSEWPQAYQAILNMGDNILIETPPRGDIGACGNAYLSAINDRLDQEQNSVLLGQFRRQTDPSKVDKLVWVIKNKRELQRRAYIFPSQCNPHIYEILSDFDSKTLNKYNFMGLLQSKWEAGINLLTFKMLNGSYPSTKSLAKALEPLTKVPTNDLKPHNLIVQGTQLKVIDVADPILEPLKNNTREPFAFLNHGEILKVIKANTPEELRQICTKIYGNAID